MEKKRYFVLALFLVCLSLHFIYQRSESNFSSLEEKLQQNPETLLNDIKEEIFEVFLNDMTEFGNICLVGLRGALIDEWIKLIGDYNKSASNVFIIGAVEKHEMVLPDIRVIETHGTLKEALAEFVFAQQHHECNIIHFGVLNSQDNWEAAWLAMRMVRGDKYGKNIVLWSKDYFSYDVASVFNIPMSFTNEDCLQSFCAGSLKPISFTAHNDVALQIQYAKHIPKKGYSINFFAYNPNADTLKKVFRELLASAKTYRQNHPRGGPVQLILFTNDRNFKNEDGYFDRIVGIKEEFMFNNERQWTTRVIYSSFAPARISLFVDADTWNCREMLSFFEFMDSHEFDFSINGHRPHDIHLPDCGVYAWKWTSATQRLMAQWFNEFDASFSGDDQARLHRALKKLKGEVVIGRTRATHAGRFAPGEGEGVLTFFVFQQGWGSERAHQQTMILTGPVHIIHAREAKPDVCDVLNQHSNTKRVFVCRSGFNTNSQLTADEKADLLRDCLHPVFNQSACNAELDNVCFYKNDWNAEPEMIIRAPDFHVQYFFTTSFVLLPMVVLVLVVKQRNSRRSKIQIMSLLYLEILDD